MNEPTKHEAQLDSLKQVEEQESNVHIAIKAVAIAGALFHLAVLGLYPVGLYVFRGTSLFAAILLVVLIYPTRGRGLLGRAFDGIILAMGTASSIYFLLNAEEIHMRAGLWPTATDTYMGLVAIITVVEIARRATGPGISILVVLAYFYGVYGDSFPGFMRHGGIDFGMMTSSLYTPLGLYGTLMGVATNYVVPFVIFGAFLGVSGVAKFFIDLSQAIAARARGGPAKIAVVASALMGSISGFSVSNVLTTGALTIPVMKRAGYKPQFAGAVEATASVGGQFVPPVMGAAAFLIAENLGVSYGIIIVAALIPAFLYFCSVLWMVDLEAVRLNLRGSAAADIPKLLPVLAKGWHLLLPIIFVVLALVVWQVSPVRAILWGIIASIVVSWVRAETRMGPKEILLALDLGMRRSVTTIAICAAAGIFVGILSLTGLGLRLSSTLVGMAGGELWIALLVTMVICLILGMGMPSTAAYAVPAVIVAPALIRLGMDPLAAHFFVFFFAVISALTPPVAVAAYAAAPIAGANAWRVGMTAFRLGLIAFIIPFMFAFDQALLMTEGTVSHIIIAVLSALVGVIAFGSSLQGILINRLPLLARLVLFCAAISLISPTVRWDLLGLALFGIVLAYDWLIVSKRVARRLGRVE